VGFAAGRQGLPGPSPQLPCICPPTTAATSFPFDAAHFAQAAQGAFLPAQPPAYSQGLPPSIDFIKGQACLSQGGRQLPGSCVRLPEQSFAAASIPRSPSSVGGASAAASRGTGKPVAMDEESDDGASTASGAGSAAGDSESAGSGSSSSNTVDVSFRLLRHTYRLQMQSQPARSTGTMSLSWRPTPETQVAQAGAAAQSMTQQQQSGLSAARAMMYFVLLGYVVNQVCIASLCCFLSAWLLRCVRRVCLSTEFCPQRLLPSWCALRCGKAASAASANPSARAVRCKYVLISFSLAGGSSVLLGFRTRQCSSPLDFRVFALWTC
jgi:hypothetical protein